MKAAVVRVSGGPPVVVDRLTIDPGSRSRPDPELDFGPDLGSDSGMDIGSDSGMDIGATAEPGPRQVRVRADAFGPRAVCPGSRQGGRVESVAGAAHGTVPAPIVDAVPNRTRVNGSSVGTRQDLAEVVTVRTADGPHPGVPHVPSPDRSGESTDDSRSPRPTGAGTARSTRPRTPVPPRPPTCTPDDLLAAPAR
ncbi:hypothetical protein ACGFSG_31225 [Streptomyces sp. NPDC048512]|uniref:hypothetical protein n=1 Tax=Streptomyces sp. NPDC048512 TaxID=3365563 RepID=UPI003724AD4D